MNNLYLIEGDNQILIDKEIKRLISKEKDIDIIRYNLDEKLLDDLIEALDTYDMFSHKKVIIGYNPPFYQNVIENYDYSKFLKYLINPSENILIIVTNKINNRLKVVKDSIKYFKYIKIDSINMNSFIKQNLDNYRMDNITISYFIDKVGNNYNQVINELNKLKSLKLDTKIISREDIDLVCLKNYDNTIFDFIDAIIKHENIKVINLYNYFISNGTEVFQMLILLSNQIRLIYNVKVLKNMNDREISSILDVHEYPVKLARSKALNYKKNELLNILYNLGKIDEDIKSGKQIANISFLSYILNI